MNNYIATFYTHYGALKFIKACKILAFDSKPMPVPRKLSSSCGTCVWFEAPSHSEICDTAVHEDLENVYLVCGKDDYKELGISFA